jgi:hypothetical protein
VLLKKLWANSKVDVLPNDEDQDKRKIFWLTIWNGGKRVKSFLYILEPMIPRRKGRTVVEVLKPFPKSK